MTTGPDRQHCTDHEILLLISEDVCDLKKDITRLRQALATQDAAAHNRINILDKRVDKIDIELATQRGASKVLAGIAALGGGTLSAALLTILTRIGGSG